MGKTFRNKSYNKALVEDDRWKMKGGPHNKPTKSRVKLKEDLWQELEELEDGRTPRRGS